MDRSELEDLAAAALLEGKRDAYVSQTVAEAYEVAITVIDVVEPLIREDERALIGAKKGLDMPAIEAEIKANGERIRDAAGAAVLTDIRAQVEALRDEAQSCAEDDSLSQPTQNIWKTKALAYARVVTLLDGGSE